MTSIPSARSTKLCGKLQMLKDASGRLIRLPLAIILTASLTACSTLLEDATVWTALAADQAAKEQAKEVAAAKAAPPVEAKIKVPDIPPYIEKCVRYGLALQKQKQAVQKAATTEKKPTADELVLQEVKTADERAACDKAVLDYYRTIQRANGQKQKVADKAKTS